MDKFEEFETMVTGWLYSHRILVIMVGTSLFTITILCLMLALVAGTAGFGVVYAMQANSHAGNQSFCLASRHAVDDKEMHNWDTLIMPVAGFMFQWVYWLIVFLVIGYISLSLYFVSRGIYRWRNT